MSKRKYTLLLVICLCCNHLSYKAYSQCNGTLPVVNDFIARPTLLTCNDSDPNITGVVNTGYETYLQPGNPTAKLQGMVWDGAQGSFAWLFPTADRGNIYFNTVIVDGTALDKLNDPDIVVYMPNAANAFALIVGEAVTSNPANNGKIAWMVFRWNSTTFVPHASGYLGSNATGIKCKNPNVDMNRCSNVVITWHQEYTEAVTTTTSSPNHFDFGPTTMNVLRADVYGAFGWVDGTSCDHTGAIRGYSSLAGDLISTPTDVNHLFERNIKPDVCQHDHLLASPTCSDRGYITFTWVQEWFNPATFTIKRRLIAKQYKYTTENSGCENGSFNIFTFNIPSYDNNSRPRIAARPRYHYNIPSDFQIVMGTTTNSCSLGTVCTSACNIITASAIYNWGINNSIVPDPDSDPFILSSSPCNLSGYYNYDPVVSYTSSEWSNSTGDYVVAWVHGPRYSDCTNGISNTHEKDIVARTYNNGVPKAGFNCFSIINRNTCNMPNQAGDQTIPSIGGRFLTNGSFGQMGFCYYDQQIPSHFYIAHRATSPNVFLATAIMV